MYSLLIADDEEMIRNGLKTMVPWEKLGFEVAACVPDGRDAMEWLADKHADVVLTDIRMTFVSGLELAEYIYRERPQTKVVIISGYKDFDYAKQAIAYNVSEYILKPTQILEVSRVFDKICGELKKEREERERLEEERRQYEELLPVLREEFFTDLLAGGLRDRANIQRRAGALGFEEGFDRAPCHLHCAVIDNYEEYLENTWEYGRAGLSTAIENIIADEALTCFLVGIRKDRFLVFSIERASGSPPLEPSVVESKMDAIRGTVETLLGIRMRLELLHSFCSIYEVKGHHLDYRMRAERGGPDGPKGDVLLNGYERQKLLLTYVKEGNANEAIALLETFADELKAYDLRYQRNFFVELFSVLGNRLKGMDIDAYIANNEAFDYYTILRLNNAQSIVEWGRNLLRLVVARANRKNLGSESKIIEKAKKYIAENYQKDITLDDVADHVYLSRVYFSRFFKQKTGENFIDYLIRVRMEKAMSLLSETNVKVYEVAQDVGYRSVRHFSNIFRKYASATPSDYRRKVQEEGEL